MKVSLDPVTENMSWKELEDYYGSLVSIQLVHDSTLPVDVFLEISRTGKRYVTLVGDIHDFGSTESELTRDQVTSACDAVTGTSDRHMFDDTMFPEFGMKVYFDYHAMSPAEFLDTYEVKDPLNRFEQYLSGNPFIAT